MMAWRQTGHPAKGVQSGKGDGSAWRWCPEYSGTVATDSFDHAAAVRHRLPRRSFCADYNGVFSRSCMLFAQSSSLSTASANAFVFMSEAGIQLTFFGEYGPDPHTRFDSDGGNLEVNPRAFHITGHCRFEHFPLVNANRAVQTCCCKMKIANTILSQILAEFADCRRKKSVIDLPVWAAGHRHAFRM